MKLETLFVCPKCKGSLDHFDLYYECRSCDIKYPVSHNVPVFITGDIGSDQMSEFWDNGWKNRTSATDHQFLTKETADELRCRMLESVSELMATQHTIMDTMPIDDQVVLNIGCGTGEAPLFMVLGANNYIGIDYSFTAAKMSFDTIQKLGGGGITAQGNAEALPVESDSIDVIYSNGVLHHTPETQKTLDEVYRVLKPSGKAVIGLYNTYSPHFINDRIIGTIKGIFKKNGNKWYAFGEGAWGVDGSTNPWTKTYSKRELQSMLSVYDLSHLELRRCGFHWGNALPILGKYIHGTKVANMLAKYLDSILGAMWVITFKKK